MTIFKPCDVRGVVGQDLDEAVVQRIGRSLGSLLRSEHQAAICVGGDFRRSTPALKQALIEGLVAVGIHVRDVGQVPTPVVYFAGRHLDCPNVAVITASHNPGRYNGVKFSVAGNPAVPDLMRQLQAGLAGPWPTDSRGKCTAQDVLPAYEAWLLEQSATVVQGARTIRPAVVRHGREMKVAVDTMAGATTHLAPRVLRAAGYEVSSLSDQLDPDFDARQPDPSQDANLQPLQARVRSEGADLGCALDGDGDRVIFVDRTGRIVRPEQIGALLATYCFERPTLVYDLKCASVLARTVASLGGSAVISPSGHGFIKQAMAECRANLGVEVSGHHFLGVLGGGDDGLLTALIVCRLLSAVGQPLEQLLEPFGWPAITPDLRVPYAGDSTAALAAIAAQCGGRLTRLDGVRAEYEAGWALARTSITEPAITLRFEGRDGNHLREIAARFLDGVPDLRDTVLRMIAECGVRNGDRVGAATR